MSNKSGSVDNIYKLDGKVPVGKAIPFGLQHILAMFVANIAPIIIVAGASGLDSKDSAMLIQSAMIIAGIGTLIQLFPLWKIGSGLPIVMGISFTFVSVFCYLGPTYGYNAIVGGIVTFLTMVLGEHWILFVLFLLFNVIDFITGWMKARMTKKENSIKGFKGVIKKLGYWLIILVSFSTSVLFIEIGEVLKIDLSITTMLGWFVLASLAINEIRSIIENIVESGYKVPHILIKGLDIANKVINKKEDD